MNKTFKVNRSGFDFLPYVRFRSPTALESSVLGFRCVRYK